MGLLNKTRCYLVGHMQYAEPGDWREQVKQDLADSNIVFFDPLNKPFISDIDENSNTRDFLNKKLLRVKMLGVVWLIGVKTLLSMT